MSDQDDYYHVLGVAPAAGLEEIRAAYRRLARQYHPDVHPSAADQAFAHTMMSRINEAYHTLSDPQRRAGYDILLASHRLTWTHTVGGGRFYGRVRPRLSLWSALSPILILSGTLLVGYVIYQLLQNIPLLRADSPGEGLPVFLGGLMFIAIMLWLLAQIKR